MVAVNACSPCYFTSVCPSFSEGVVLLLLRCFWSGCSLVCIQDPTYPLERQPEETHTSKEAHDGVVKIVVTFLMTIYNFFPQTKFTFHQHDCHHFQMNIRLFML